jgi:hypothetical protein
VSLGPHIGTFEKADDNDLNVDQAFDAKAHRKLVAETGADGDLMTALGAAAAEHCGTCLRLHAGEEAVGLRAMAAVGLKSTLRHNKKLLRREQHLLKLLGCCNNL